MRRRRGPRVVRVRLDLRLGAPQTGAQARRLRLPGLLELRDLAAQVVAFPRMDDEAPEPASNVARAELERVEAVIVVHSRERDDLRGEVAKLQQAWEAESAGLRASLRGAEAQVKSHADDARAAAATHDALLGSGSSGSVSSPP